MVNPKIIVLNTYINSQTEVQYICECGSIDSKKAYSLLEHPRCASCGNKNPSNKLTHQMFVDKMKVINPNIIILGNYVNSKEKVKFQCECGNVDFAIPNSLLKGHKCWKCGIVRRSNNNRISSDEIENRIKLINPSIRLLSKYTRRRDNIKCECLECGHIWDTLADSLLNMHTGCPNCLISKGEKRIKTFLDKKDIQYIQQYRLDDCRNTYPLPYDFAILFNDELLCLIEYDGKQHYEPWHKIHDAIERLKIIQFRDNIKNNYCKSNNIKLIRIPYWDYDNIEHILTKELLLKEGAT
jgi:hypothetical protein